MAQTFTFDTNAVEKGLANLLIRHKPVIGELLVETMNDILVPRIQKEIVDNNSIVSGKLKDKVKAVLIKSTTKRKSNVVRVVVSPQGVPYAADVEFGTKPGRNVPISKMKQFVAKKLNISGAERTRVAWAIKNSIKRKGTKPHPYMAPALKKAIPKLKTELPRRFKQQFLRKLVK